MQTAMRRLDDPFHAVTANRREGMLDRTSGHSIYWNEAGHPNGMPVCVCHGGPGSGSNPSRRRFYDPAVWRVVMFDQRGCGRSTPAGSLEDNTLEATIGDMEALRAELGIERWVVAGGSWGSTVAVAYAQAHPECCMGLSLTCMWLAREMDIDWCVLFLFFLLDQLSTSRSFGGFSGVVSVKSGGSFLTRFR